MKIFLAEQRAGECEGRVAASHLRYNTHPALLTIHPPLLYGLLSSLKRVSRLRR